MRMLLGVAVAACMTAGAPAFATTIDRDDHSISDVRNARYCEIIPVVRDGFHFVATVYNTLGENDCPPALWDKITEAEMKRLFAASHVVLNGPRHFLMDRIIADGATAEGKTVDVGGMKMKQRATIDIGLFDLRHQPYRERTIDRETRYVFEAGKPVFVLTAPGGARYAMQAYAQIVDKALSYEQLPQLAERLKLPAGWHYEAMTPKVDLVLGAKGDATIVQDDLQDTYQKIE